MNEHRDFLSRALVFNLTTATLAAGLGVGLFHLVAVIAGINDGRAAMVSGFWFVCVALQFFVASLRDLVAARRRTGGSLANMVTLVPLSLRKVLDPLHPRLSFLYGTLLAAVLLLIFGQIGKYFIPAGSPSAIINPAEAFFDTLAISIVFAALSDTLYRARTKLAPAGQATSETVVRPVKLTGVAAIFVGLAALAITYWSHAQSPTLPTMVSAFGFFATAFFAAILALNSGQSRATSLEAESSISCAEVEPAKDDFHDAAEGPEVIEALEAIGIDSHEWDSLPRSHSSIAFRDALGIALQKSNADLVQAMIGRSTDGMLAWSVTVRTAGDAIDTLMVRLNGMKPFSLPALSLLIVQVRSMIAKRS